ncbi:GNAT family N-acetyltransferase [Vibrio tritonius]|uniref:GNAT family N-acetyltransferase n=1 Tax=Vibrio tritonius TaxID=1435069 RepID=UPI000837B146|nr:GNAT family N-acetyltransferase [Vibrio tritonius]
MARLSSVFITPATVLDLDAFYRYAQQQFDTNGMGNTPLFMPDAPGTSVWGESLKQAYKQGLTAAQNQPTWRRLWLARNEQKEIIGDVSLRRDEFDDDNDRVWLGIGVAHCYRGHGLGEQLLSMVLDVAKQNQRINWVDLKVLDTNLPAIQLYRKLGFVEVSYIPERYQVDNEPVGEFMMSYQVA